MNTNNEQKEEKGGFWAALSGLFRGGSSVAGGGASSGFGTAGGLFASKAGIMGMVLGGATIAAGVGVVYNFVGSTSKPVYSPELFQNSFYEEESAAAGLKREQAKDRSSASASTLDMFSDQAKKDGLGLASEAGGEDSQASGEAAAGAEDPSAAGAAPAAETYGGDGGGGGGARLQPSAGFGGGGGGSSSSSMPRLQNGGGLSSGIGGKFTSMGLAGAAGGKASAMGGATTARVRNSPTYVARNFKRTGSLSQAKFANRMGNKAVYSTGASMRNSAEEAFSGETSGAGDVEGGPGGDGMSGDGLSTGSGLKANDPNLNNNKYEVPEPKDTEIKDVSPWNKLYDKMMKFGAIALGLIVVAKILGGLAKRSIPPWSGIFYWAAMAAAAAAIAAAAVVFAQAWKLMKGVSSQPPAATDWAGQPAIAIPIMLVSIKLGIMAWDAACGLEKGQGTARVDNQSLPKEQRLLRNDGTEIKGKVGNEPPKAGHLSGLQSENWGINELFGSLKSSVLGFLK